MELPYEITQGVIQCFGKCFYYKEKMEAFLRAGRGVSPGMSQKCRDEYKFVWARKTLSDLSQSEQGQAIARRVVTELCKLRNVTDDGVQDRNAALDALRNLKALAAQHDMTVEEAKDAGNHRQALAKQREKVVAERAATLDDLRKRFSDAFVNPDRQTAGYVDGLWNRNDVDTAVLPSGRPSEGDIVAHAVEPVCNERLELVRLEAMQFIRVLLQNPKKLR